MNSSLHPTLGHLIVATISQSEESDTSVQPTRLNKLRFHEFYNIGYFVCIHFSHSTANTLCYVHEL
jgi:hypothetical protein